MGFQAWWGGWMCSGSRGMSPEHLPKCPPFPWWSSSCRSPPSSFQGSTACRSKVSTEPCVPWAASCLLVLSSGPRDRAGRLVQHDAQGNGATFPPGSWYFTQPQSPAPASPRQGSCSPEIEVFTLFPPTAQDPPGF